MKIQELDIDNELKSQLLEAVSDQKKFGLIWENHPENAEENLRKMIPVLTEDKDKFISSDAEDAPNHILIEGDNLEALTALTYTHEGKVDVIYIDPPYNTGNKDFVYNDSYVDSEDGYRHSKWLSFMEKRLRIAKKLLSDRGVIFISIDDNEQANLKLLCDEVFGERQFISNLVWQKKFSRSNDALYFSTMHDHILCYCRMHIQDNVNGWKIGLLDRIGTIPKGYSNPDNDPRGVWTSTIMSAKSGSSSLLYSITTPGGRVVTPPDGRFWSCSKETFESWRSDNRIWFGKDGNGTPRKKTFLSEVQEGLRPNSLILQEEGGNNQEGKQELKSIFNGEGLFDGPKPTKLLNLLLRIANAKDATVLDFFAGSGTTLHATMQLNAEDGGHRQCILVTNNENNICEEVTYERNKRVINGYTTPKGVEVPGLTHNNLRYYKTAFVPRENTHQSLKEQAYAITDLLCIKEGIYTEQTEFGGLSLKGKSKMVRYFADNGGKMLLLYDSRVIPFIVGEIAKMNEEDLNIKVYVFADGSYPYSADFEDVMKKVTLIAIPYAMNQALRHVLPAMQETELEGEPETEEN